ncbi:hypothetical protein [Colwellia sp. MB02u-9]|uniref:hypothetical protein n=1 Tax=Colwellia sp. MB02u-9 TaxID=2759823 RepID=UPI0015F64B3D|nr:hypothetical protein [Colwellia sp. MB02u-9]MBA6296673.1 hypothetical protein [Colwellia sp. MB02u-9]
MAQVNNSLWQRHKYKISALVLILPVYFFYQSLSPEFPNPWAAQKMATFEIIPTPYDLEPPYLHDGHYTKDFMLTFSQGNIADIRQAYLNIGKESLPLTMLQAGDEGILHGSQHGLEVHAIAPAMIKPAHKLWLTIQSWHGKQMVMSWDLPKEILPK